MLHLITCFDNSKYLAMLSSYLNMTKQSFHSLFYYVYHIYFFNFLMFIFLKNEFRSLHMEFFITQLIMGQIEIQPVPYLSSFTK